jgi:DNA-binding MarR family transcriptional regulator
MATSSSIADVAAQLRISVARTARRMRQQAGGDLSPTQGAALATLDRHGPLTPSELAARERIQRPTATRLIARLESQGLVARTRDPQDGRSTLIALTDAGRALLAEQRTRKNAFLERRLRELAPGDREVLERAAHLLDRMLEEDGA